MNMKLKLLALIGLMFLQIGLVNAMEEAGRPTQEQINHALMAAARANNAPEIERLIGEGVNINYQDVVNRETPLHKAARGGHSDAVAALIKAGANIEARDENGQTPLRLAIATRYGAEAIPVLIESGANVETSDRYDQTPMQGALRTRYLEGIRALITSASPREIEPILPNIMSVNELNGEDIGSIVATRFLPELVTRKLNAAKKELPDVTELLLRQDIINSINRVIRNLLTTVSPQEVQHIIPTIGVLTRRKGGPVTSVIGKDVGNIIVHQLKPAIINQKLALARKYFPNVPEAELRQDIVDNINKAIKSSR